MTAYQWFLIAGAVFSWVLAVFQILLSAGLPFGYLAWGGQHRKLPPKLRISSLISAIMLIYASFILLETANVVHIVGNHTVMSISQWIFVIIFGLSTLGNISSKSRSEKRIMTPVAVCLFIIFLLTAIQNI